MYIYKTTPPSLGFAERGGSGVLESVPFSSGSFQSPEVKHDSPPSATSEHNSFFDFICNSATVPLKYDLTLCVLSG